MKTIYNICFVMIVLLCIASFALAQNPSVQVVGQFPQMDGGFEGQTTGPLTMVSTISSGSQSYVWTTKDANQATINSGSARTGSKYNQYFPAVTRDRLQSPTAPNNVIKDATLYTMQYYYRTSTSAPPGPYLRMAVSPSGTGGLTVFQGQNPAGTNGLWVMYRDTVKSSTAGTAPRYGVVSVGCRDTIFSSSMDIDDFVVYEGLPDSSVPDVPVAPALVWSTSTQIKLRWTPPSSGVDSGGYVVVRRLGSDPTTVPNPNGIYAKGNSLSSDEAVAYVGTDTFFVDNGLASSTHYYYRIYTVDKAFNYSSTGATIDGSTGSGVLAGEPTTQASSVSFSSITSNSMTINWTNGNGTSRIVVIRAASAVTSVPVDGSIYEADSQFGKGYTEMNPGEYVVFNGSGNSVTVTGLSKLTRYYVAIFEYLGSSGSENYLTTSPGTGDDITLPGSVISSASGLWTDGATWVDGVVPSQSDNVTVSSGHTITLPSTQAAYNLTIENGGVLYSNTSLPIASTSIRYIRIYGGTVTNNGTIGGTADAIGIEVFANTILTGTGTLQPCRVRVASNQKNISITFDQNATLTYTGTDGSGGTALYAENVNNENVTITVNNGKTVTFADYSSFYLNNGNSNDSTTNVVININGTVDLSAANSNMGLKVSPSITCILNVNGTLKVGRNFNASSTAPGGVATINIGSSGSITVGGIADFTSPTVTVTGGGAFTLADGATIYIGSPDGLSASGATGNVQTATRQFSKLANYRYIGGSIPQSTGTGLPDTIRQLIISDTLVTLTNNVTVTDTLHCSTGDLDLNGKIITLGPLGFLREPVGSSVIGSAGYITTTRTIDAPDNINVAGLGIVLSSTANLGSTTVTRGHTVQTGNSIKRYFDIIPSNNTDLNATLLFNYQDAELNGFPQSMLQLFKSEDSGSSWTAQGGVVDDALNTITLTGVNTLSRWTAAALRPIVVNSGWNMLSLPYIVDDYRKSVIFPSSISDAFAYENAHYISKDLLANMLGFWLKYAAKETINVRGGNHFEDSVSVVEGWNMVGTISDTLLASNIKQSETGLVISPYFGFGTAYAVVDTLLPGKAYWVKTSGSGKLYMDTTTVLEKATTGVSGILEQMNSLTVTDNAGRQQVLYFGQSQNTSASVFELPPQAPEMPFDVRFVSNRFAEPLSEKMENCIELPFIIEAKDYPLTLKWHVKGDLSYSLHDGTGNKQIITGDGSFMLRKSVKKYVIEVSGSTMLPTEFSLGNNYPNPFNPSTKFSIAVPKTAHVEVVVYDILGKVVRTLMNGEQSAGYHTIEWNGLSDDHSTVSTGLYFVRMVSDKFTAIKKIMMVK